jgi:hypothetical protein
MVSPSTRDTAPPLISAALIKHGASPIHRELFLRKVLG